MFAMVLTPTNEPSGDGAEVLQLVVQRLHVTETPSQLRTLHVFQVASAFVALMDLTQPYRLERHATTARRRPGSWKVKVKHPDKH